MSAAIGRFERALAVEGVDSRVLDANLNMLDASFGSHNFTFRQYQNVFQFLVNSVTELSANAILSHDQVLHTVLSNDTRQCEARSPVGRRRRRDGPARRAGVGAGHAGARPLRGRRPAPHLAAQRTPGQPGPHPHDELRPGTAGVAHPQGQAQHRRPADPGLQGPGAQADGVVRSQRARGLHLDHGAVQRHAGAVVPAPLRRHHPAHPQGPRTQLEKKTRLRLGDPAGARCCCRSARGPRSPCPAS